MDSTFKKMGLAIATSMVALTSSVNAADDHAAKLKDLNLRLTALEKSKAPKGMVNPPVQPVVKGGANLAFNGDILYLRATEGSLDYVHTPSSVENAAYDWTWGFRLGATYELPHDGWDVRANWTRFRGREDRSKNAFIGSSFASEVIDLETPPTATSASSRVRLRLNLVDVELGREFYTSKYLTIRPHFGVRGGWIHRAYVAQYGGVPNATPSEVVYNNHRHRGIGARGGLETQWGLKSGFSLFGNAAVSGLYGAKKIAIVQNVEDSSTGVIQITPGPSLLSRQKSVQTITDLAVGIRWDQTLGEDEYRLRLQLGWEQQIFDAFTKKTNVSSPLTTNGVAFRALFNF